MKLSTDRILLDVDVNSFESVVRSLAECLPAEIDREAVVRGVLAREALGSTMLCEQVCVPHVRLDTVDEVQMAVARLATSRALAPHSDAIQLVVLLVSPAARPAEHLKALAALAGTMQDESVRARLLREPDPVTIAQMVTAS